MATAKDIEEVFGIPDRTIATWSRTKGSQFLLSKFLKSFSKYDLEDRINRILVQEGYIKMSGQEFVDKLLKHLDLTGITEFKNITQWDPIGHDPKGPIDIVVNIDGKLYGIELKQTMPSKVNIQKEIEKFDAYIEKKHNQSLQHIIYINSNNTLPKSIEDDPSLKNRVSIYSYDEISMNLFNTKVIFI